MSKTTENLCGNSHVRTVFNSVVLTPLQKNQYPMFLSCLLLFAIALVLGRLFMQTTEEIPALIVGILAIIFLIAGIITAPAPIQIGCLIAAASLKKFMLKHQEV